MPRILVVEDEPGIAMALQDELAAEGYDVELARDGGAALEHGRTGRFDGIVLDVMLPIKDGFVVCRELRAEGVRTPILMLTARTQEEDTVCGLDLGADDYVTKPFAFEELLARIEALSRRPRQLSARVVSVADLEIDLDAREVRRGGTLIELTPKEYTVLEYLMRHAGRVMSRTLITEYAWDYHFDPGTNIVDVVITRLRKKVDHGFDAKLIHTVRGVGYLLRTD